VPEPSNAEIVVPERTLVPVITIPIRIVPDEAIVTVNVVPEIEPVPEKALVVLLKNTYGLSTELGTVTTCGSAANEPVGVPVNSIT
jgi:hypothetical protein